MVYNRTICNIWCTILRISMVVKITVSRIVTLTKNGKIIQICKRATKYKRAEDLGVFLKNKVKHKVKRQEYTNSQ